MSSLGGRASTGPLAASFTSGALSAFCLWTMDMATVKSAGARLDVVLAALFLIFLPLVPASVVAGIFLRVVLGPGDPFVKAWQTVRSVWTKVLKKDPRGGWRFIWLSLSILVYLPLTFQVSYMACRALANEVATAHFQALLSAAATLAALIVLAPVPVFIRSLGGRLDVLAELPGISLLWSRVIYPAVVEVLLVGVGVTLAVIKLKTAILTSPWQTPAMVVGGIAMGTVAAAALSRLFSRTLVSVSFSLVVLVLVVISAACALSLDATDRDARAFLGQSRSARLMNQLLTRALDRDLDGYMHMFAGGDCDPDDPGFSPAALDIPGNGLDEDCDGVDAKRSYVETGRWDFPIPETFPTHNLPVLLVTDDALSANHVSFMGYPRKTTPNLDAFSQKCVVFGKAFSQGPSTRLSLASMFTGLYDSQVLRGESRRVPQPLAIENHTLAEAFLQAGWETVAVIPNSYFDQRWRGLLQGFQQVDRSAVVDRKKTDEAVHNAALVTDAALEQIRKERAKPLFLWVHYYDNHPPFGQPEGVVSFGTSRKDLYDAEVSFYDQHLARLLHGIEEQFGASGYLLILSADHGSSFDNNHPVRSHGYDLHTSVLHIPLLFCSPSIKPRWEGETPVSLLDLFPTLANLFGLPVKTPFEGTSLVPLLLAGESWPDRMVFHQFFLPEKARKGEETLRAASVRNARYNLIWDRREGTRKLFDYLQDPFEEVDLSTERPQVIRELEGALNSWLLKVYAPTQQMTREEKRPRETTDGDYVDQY